MSEETQPRWIWFAAAIVLGMALRLVGLGTQSLWLDEMTSIEVARQPIHLILTGRIFDNHTPPLYYALLHFWARLVPLTEVGLRLPSALIDVLNMALLAVLCRRFCSRIGSLLVVTAYALAPFILYYSQEGRMYTLTVFFTLAYTLAVERVIDSEKYLMPWTILAGVLLGLGLYTHYYFAFYAAGLLSAALFIVKSSRKRLAAIMASGFLGGLLFAPWVPIALHLADSDGQTFRNFVFSVIPYTLFRFVVGYAVFPLNMHTKDDFVGTVLTNAWCLAAVFGSLAFLGLELLRSMDRRTSRFVLILGWLVTLPAAVGLLISLKMPILSERYLIVIFPFFLILLLGVQDLTRKSTRIALGFFFALLIAGDFAYFFNPLFGKAQWREAAGYVSSTLGDTGLVFVEPEYSTSVFRYYFHERQPVYGLTTARLGQDFQLAEADVRRRLAGHREAVLVTSGLFSEGSGYAQVLSKFARKTSVRTFDLDTGITCSTWEIAGRDS